jgi:pimeloyl-ACP methyl ester carboxylesterase
LDRLPLIVRTFVLIPGAGGVAWYWSRVAVLLEAEGHEAIAVDLPGDDEAAGLAEYTQITLDAVGDRSGAVVVGQSLGAFTAAMVASRLDTRAIIFVNGMIPEPGETPGEWWETSGYSGVREAAAIERGYSTEFDVQTYFLHDVDPEIAQDGAPLQREEADAVFGSRCEFAALPDVPIHVVAGEDDRFFPVGFQQRLARERLGVEADVLPGGHLTALAQPKRLARYLLDRS